MSDEEGGHGPEEEWATLREASVRYGVAVSTLRKWYSPRGGEALVRSKMQDGPYGPQRVVSLADVAARLAGPSRAGAKVSPGPGVVTPVADMLPVPVDAWNQVLHQLGNLHQAGQDLAEWRDRAARSETTVEHLTARMVDLRVEIGELKSALREAYEELEGDRRTKGRRRWWHRLIGKGGDEAGPVAGAGAA